MKKTNLIVKTDSHKYSIVIGDGLLNNISTELKKKFLNFNKCLIIVDKKVPKKLVNQIYSSLKIKKKYIHLFNSSEANKNQISINKILNILLKKNFYRDDCIISVGGGITGDVTGYAASIFKRGIKFINIPTTLLAQVDSSIGGKTGINSNYGKNLIGSFYQPSLVISDINFLKTLPRREIICGYAEILKHSLILNKKFFNFLDKFGNKIISLNKINLKMAIYESCLIKKKIIQLDEKEKNLRKILNFGHTFAHAYEATMKYSNKLNHGEAVLLGIISAIKFAKINKILSIKEFDLIYNHFEKLNLPRKINKFFIKKDINKILSFMHKDKKNKNDKINLVLLKKIGKATYGQYVNEKKLYNFLKNELSN